MTKKINSVRPARYCECGCGGKLSANIQQRFTPACRAKRATESSRVAGVVYREAQRHKVRLCACGNPIVRKGMHSCDPCRIAKAMAAISRERADTIKMPTGEYAQITPMFTPWVRRDKPLPLSVQAELDERQAKINLAAHRSGWSKDPGKVYTRAEIDAIAGRITPIHMIPAGSRVFVGPGMLSF